MQRDNNKNASSSLPSAAALLPSPQQRRLYSSQSGIIGCIFIASLLFIVNRYKNFLTSFIQDYHLQQAPATMTTKSTTTSMMLKRPHRPLLPPYNEIYNTSKQHIIENSNVRHVINFLIAGFPKCGTTTMITALGMVGQTPPQGDTCANPTSLIPQLYNRFGFWDKNGGNNNSKIRGVKCPASIERPSYMKNFIQYFNETKLIIGVRHPVLSFESFFNMQVQAKGDIGPVVDRTASCPNEDKGSSTQGCKAGGCYKQLFCTNRGRYHKFLAQLGKTPLSKEERNLIPHPLSMNIKGGKITNPIFIYETSQLQDRQFWNDLGEFLDLGIEERIPHEVWYKPGRTGLSTKQQAQRDQYKIDICDDEHSYTRNILQQHAKESGRWIREYFLEASDVYYSQKDELIQIFKEWENVDPCIERKRKQKKNKEKVEEENNKLVVT